MRHKSSAITKQNRETQLHAIRDLMISAAGRGAWLTLGEIARLTEIGEASISAQLRHLRKARHGRHRVEKRPRRNPARDDFERTARSKSRRGGGAVIWEYRVLPRGMSAAPIVGTPQWGEAVRAQDATALLAMEEPAPSEVGAACESGAGEGAPGCAAEESCRQAIEEARHAEARN
jgi:hypothetical protein